MIYYTQFDLLFLCFPWRKLDWFGIVGSLLACSLLLFVYEMLKFEFNTLLLNKQGNTFIVDQTLLSLFIIG